VSLLEDVIEAHGGRRRWQKADEVVAHVRSGGLLMRSKLKAGRFRDYGISIATDRQNAILQPYPRAGRTGVFDGGEVCILDSGGDVIDQRGRGREAFFGLPGARRKLWWSDLDALYFAGYAMWNYLSTPWIFESPGFEVGEGEPLRSGGESWRRLEVTFPEGFHTHCRHQSFYYDSRGYLRRHDYRPDVVSSRANAAHLCSGHIEVGGLVFPTSRKVVPKGPGGRPLPGPTVVSIELSSIGVN
jgi:hypothetical protein